MSLSLDEIKKPIAAELQQFEEKFKASMRSKTALLDKIMYYIVQHKGKQMRPMFVLFCAQLEGEINERTYRGAALVELLHTATLVHDDVVDDSRRRRGIFSINALWKNKIAVLVGDYLLSKGLLLAVENREYEPLQIVSRAVKEMSEGELLQMEKARLLDIDEAVYFDIIRQKTSTLIASACEIGYYSGNENGIHRNDVRLFGEKLGIAFQIRDDLFDFSHDNIGKPSGIDIKEKKLTLPLIYALQNTEKDTRREMIYLIKNKNEDKNSVAKVIGFVHRSGGMEYATAKMESYKNDALHILEKMPDSAASAGLKQLVQYTIERRK